MENVFEGGECEMTRQARHTREKYVNMGFQEGVFAARQGHVQEGFDVGYTVGATRAFCQEFLRESGITECIDKYQAVLSMNEEIVDSMPDELGDLYQHIVDMLMNAAERSKQAQ
jgi:hypothetical protein